MTFRIFKKDGFQLWIDAVALSTDGLGYGLDSREEVATAMSKLSPSVTSSAAQMFGKQPHYGFYPAATHSRQSLDIAPADIIGSD